MFYTLQLIKVIPLFNIFIPATLEIYLTEIRGLLDFDKLTPDYLIGLAFPGQDMMMLVTGKNKTQEAIENPESDTSPGMKLSGNTHTDILSSL